MISRIIRRVEDILIKCSKFSLSSKRRLLEEDELNYTIVDVMQLMIERPKKTKAILFGEKEATQLKITAYHL